MKLYSDLHLDVSACDIEYGIVAGDICGRVNGICIQGNHDVLDGYEFDPVPSHVSGRRLIAGTGWCDWGYPGYPVIGSFKEAWKFLMSNGIRWSPAIERMPEGALGLDYLMNAHFEFVTRCRSFGEHTLIVTHHPPVSRSLMRLGTPASRYDAYSEHGFYSPTLGRCFFSLYDSIMEHGLTWAFGHTHERVDMVLDCRYAVPDQLVTHSGALAIENSFRVYKREFGAPYEDKPGFVRLVSNPRGYSRIANYSEFGDLYTGVDI